MNKRYIALNTHLIPCTVVFIAFLALSVRCLTENELGSGIFFGLLVLLPVFVFAISPLYFVFSDECVEIVYNFGQKEKIEWSRIKKYYAVGQLDGRRCGIAALQHCVSAKERLLFHCRRNFENRKNRKAYKEILQKENRTAVRGKSVKTA